MIIRNFQLLILILIVFPNSRIYCQDTTSFRCYFDFNKSNISTIGKLTIDSAFNENNYSSILVYGYCDQVGTDEYNDKLSLRRANRIKEYLKSKSIDENIVRVKGCGENKNSSGKFETNYLDRKVEIFLISKASFINAVHEKPDSLIFTETDSFALDNLKIGSRIRLPNINFQPGLHKLLPGSFKTLEKLCSILKSDSTLEIELQGHVCCEETSHLDGVDFETGTRNLSVNRAKVVYDYLVENGISKSRLSYKGFGSSRKLVVERTENDRVINRRVEVMIVKH